MATISALIPYLEKGYQAFDPIRHAYLTPYRQGDALKFEWRAYEMKGEWSGPDYHTREYVLTWQSSNWGIGEGHTYETQEAIDQAIASGRLYKAKGFE